MPERKNPSTAKDNVFVTDDPEQPLDENKNVIGLNLSDSKISDTLELKGLINLTKLNLSFNNITDIIGINYLKNLNILFLDNNQISEISGIKKLNKLTKLILGSNKISDISELKYLTNLNELYLFGNQISDVSTIKELKKLTRLNLTHNKIIQLPIEVFELGLEINWEWSDFKKGIFLKENPLKSPPVEIVKQGTEAVRNYFREIEQESTRLLESKLLIVGNGEVGKTTLMRKLKDNDFQVEIGKEAPTHGINIEP